MRWFFELRAYIYDSACIDYTLWSQLKKNAIYFLTRMKSNASITKCGDLKYAATDTVSPKGPKPVERRRRRHRPVMLERGLRQHVASF